MMEIIPIQYGKTTIPESMCFINGCRQNRRSIVFKIYLIKTEEKLILADAGCETMSSFKMTNFIGTVGALKYININPEEITDVVITHSHHDHIECVKYFKNATVHIQKDEYIRGKKYIPSDFKLNIFDNEFTIKENIKVLKIAGHTEGSCIVEIKANDRIHVIVGDECYLRECITNRIPTGSSFDPEASQKFIEKYSDEKYEILLCHDN